VLFNNDIGNWLKSNKTESSGNLKEHVNSIINIKTDASNLERLNRWNAAIRMFEERPIFGWGPGTYMFYYAPFQRSYQKTIISTNFGTGGNAHSEYLGLLSESGLPAVVAYILLLIVVAYKGLKISRNPNLSEYKMLILAAVLGIITYATHGVMNNFLDTDKIAIPFWAFIGFIVAMDVYAKEMKKVEKLQEFEA
jgi:O-antigen ligase